MATQVYGYDRSKSAKIWAERKNRKPLDNFGESGIIKMGSELPMNALTRKEKPNTYIEPMPKSQLQRIVRSFKTKGGII